MSLSSTFITSDLLQFFRYHSRKQLSRFIIFVLMLLCLFRNNCVFVFSCYLVAVKCFVTVFTAEVTYNDWRFLLILEKSFSLILVLFFKSFFYLKILIWRSGQFKSGMHIFTTRAVGTKTCKIIRTQHSSNVSVSAVGSVPTKAPVVPGTIFYLTFGIYVKEWALFVVAGVETGIKVTLGHFRHVVFVQEFTLVTFLTQAT